MKTTYVYTVERRLHRTWLLQGLRMKVDVLQIKMNDAWNDTVGKTTLEYKWAMSKFHSARRKYNEALKLLKKLTEIKGKDSKS